MNFQQYDIGHRQRGDVVEVTLSGSAANVRLLSPSELANYRAGRKHQYYGGLVKTSPSRIVIPRSGSWYVTVDLQGLRGQVRSSVRVIPQAALTPLPDYSPPNISNLVRRIGSNDGERQETEERTEKLETDDTSAPGYYDVFISHATEDKDEVARPLATSLVSHGLKVWYDEFELRIGDSLRRKIDFGLARSRFGVVVISPSFFAKNWPQYELDGLVTREMTGEQVILPLWHQISKQEVIGHSPSLADKVARNTSDFTVDEIAAEIADVIGEGSP